MPYVIFDLDHTVIDSSHRQNTLPDGSLDLEHWMENNHPENIMRDTLLPLANVMKTLYKTNHIIVCTARAYQTADKQFLLKHGLFYHAYLSRGPNIINADGSLTVGDNRGDAQLKIELLTEYFNSRGYSSIAEAKPIMFDDNLKVIDALIERGVSMYNAIEANRRLLAA